MPAVLLAQARAGRLPLRDDSVHCVVTSPPYYGLRSYNCPPAIFGGDPDCMHEWGDEQPAGEAYSGRNRWQHGIIGDGRKERGENYQRELRATGQLSTNNVTHGEICTRCGAWRGQLGLEPSPDMYLAHLVEIFREVKRVLRDDGTLWVNMGDSYAGGGFVPLPESKHARGLKDLPRRDNAVPPNHKPKDLMMMPARLALALQADGWYLRSAPPWLKASSMPESVTDRPSVSHEHVFLFSKRARYYWDADAVRVAHTDPNVVNGHYVRSGGRNRLDRAIENQGWVDGGGMHTRHRDYNPAGRNRRTADFWSESLDAAIAQVRAWLAHAEAVRADGGLLLDMDGNPLAFHVNPVGYSGAHFATFPPALVEPMIKAATSERGCCPTCGAPWARVVERTGGYPTTREERGWFYVGGQSGAKGLGVPSIKSEHTALGWQPTCACYDTTPLPAYPAKPKGDPTPEYEAEVARVRAIREALCAEFAALPADPCVVLDPFVGTGVSCLVARNLGRHSIGMDLSADYLRLARERTGEAALDAWRSGEPTLDPTPRIPKNGKVAVAPAQLAMEWEAGR